MVSGSVVAQAIGVPAGAQNVPSSCNLTVPLVCLEAMVTPQNSVSSAEATLESPLNQGDTVAANLTDSNGFDK